MKLLFDVGNSRAKYMFEDNGKFSPIKNIAISKINETWLRDICCSITDIYIANVSQIALTDLICAFAQRHSIRHRVIESEASCFGLRSSYQDPASLGVDRWLVMIGAKQLFPNKNLLIVDTGTATTVDIVDQQGVHLGGWILPGIDTMFDSLLVNTSKVHAAKQDMPDLTFGCNTSDCVNNAAWAATKGLIDQAVIQAKKLGNVDEIILTGGNSSRLSQLLTDKHQQIDELVFYGIRQYIS